MVGAIFRRWRRGLYLKKCKIVIKSQQTESLNMIVYVDDGIHAIETHMINLNKSSPSDSEIKDYVYSKLLEVKRWKAHK